ncbi:MAG: DUF1501 domain-containing protein [Betaproteobacteria bacterium]|nr:DUF1501 domain-containing protein [Betaproteobacteria bacterium]
MKNNYTRRDFLAASGALSVSFFLPRLGNTIQPQASANLVERNRHVLVAVFLRGGFDGLGFICPTQAPDRAPYEAARPNIGVPLSGNDAALPLTESFALNAAAKPLLPIFQQKQMAFVHACGLVTPSRSHFAAQSLVDLGSTRPGEFNSGWLSRFLKAHPCRTAAIGALKPASLLGSDEPLVLPRFKGLGLDGSPKQQRLMRTALRNIYSRPQDDARYGIAALNMLDEIENLALPSLAKNLPDLPSGEIPQKFALAAELIKHDKKLGLVTLDIGGWDTHRQQGTTGEGYFAKQLATLSTALADLHKETLSATDAWVTTIVFSEFGRRLKENASRGSDHGHGNLVMLMGSKVKGGQFHGQWPGLIHEKLFERADLAATSDLRQVFFEFLKLRAPQLQFTDVFGKSIASAQLDLFHRD